MFKSLNIILKYFFILIGLSIIPLANAQQQVNSATPSQPINNKIQLQVFELLTIDCGVDGGLDKFTTALDRLPVDVSRIFIKILQEGVPEQTHDSARRRAEANYKVRQAWLMRNGAELFDKQTVERLSKISLDDYVANSIRKLNIRYEENAIRGLKQLGNLNAIDVIKNAAKQKPELAILAEESIKTIKKRETPE